MSTLRQPLKHLDYIMNKVKREEIYMVLHEELHNVWVIKDGGGAAPFEMPKRMINMTFTKIDPKVARVLYGENQDEQESNGGDTSDSVSVDQPSE